MFVFVRVRLKCSPVMGEGLSEIHPLERNFLGPNRCVALGGFQSVAESSSAFFAANPLRIGTFGVSWLITHASTHI
jgi:hypothetical protein